MARRRATAIGKPGSGVPFLTALFAGPVLIVAYVFGTSALSPLTPSPPVAAAQAQAVPAPSQGATTRSVSLASRLVTAPAGAAPIVLAQAVEAPAVEQPKPIGRAATGKQYVSGQRVPLRSEPNDKGRVLDRCEAGQAVEVLGRRGDWIQVRHTLTQREGWIQAKRLRDEPPAEDAEAKPAKASPALSDAAITNLLIERSIADYPGPCACPYQSARNGSSCGKRAAYVRPGGYAPLCYAKDVTPEMIAAYRAGR